MSWCWRSTPTSCATFAATPMHPSTLEIMHELGLLDEFLKLPHRRARTLGGADRRRAVSPVVDFSHLPTRCKFVAHDAAMGLPGFSRRHGEALPNFHLHMQPEATDSDRAGRPRHRRARHDAGRAARDPRRPRGRLRRPPFDVARARRHEGRGHRRADGRALVPAAARSRAIPSRAWAASRPGAWWC